MCQKIKYASADEARRDARLIRVTNKARNRKATKKQGSNRRQKPYECPRCGAWHLSTQKKKHHKRLTVC